MKFKKKLLIFGVLTSFSPFLAASFCSAPTNSSKNIDVSSKINSPLVLEADLFDDPNLKVSNQIGKLTQNDYRFKDVKLNEKEKDLLIPFVDKKEVSDSYSILPNSINEKEFLLADSYTEEALREINEIATPSDVISKDGTRYYEYKDPFTKVIFREFDLTPEQSNPTFFIGSENIHLLAQEFKRKVPFGLEISDLKAININGGVEMNDAFSGLYTVGNKNIYINGNLFANYDLPIYHKIALIMPTLFHEYIHHWANSYISWNILKLNTDWLNENYDEKLTKTFNVSYKGSGLNQNGLINEKEAWNYAFSNSFLKLLNYDFDNFVSLPEDLYNLFQLEPEQIKTFVHANFTLPTIWKLANFEIRGGISEQDLERKYYYDGYYNFYHTLRDLLYFYSMTELVPREYSKFAYESYYNINEDRNDKNTYIKMDDNKIFFSSWFGNFDYEPDKNKKIVSNFKISTNNLDWSKTFLNGVSNPNRAGVYIQNSSMFPNNPFKIYDFKYYTEDGLEILDEERSNSRSIPFYQTFLKAMGYGKSIAFLNRTSKNKVQLGGYLKDQKYKGFAILDKNNKLKQTVKFKYNSIFNFFGHYDFDKGARLGENNQDREAQLNNRLYPVNKFYSYLTESSFNLTTDSQIYMWEDLNNNGIFDNGEIDYDFEFTLPETRYVTTKRSYNTSSQTLVITNDPKNNKKVVVHAV
ncbi:Uncharacterised protein [Mycoplasmopsis glycophila]|uniref:Uncharacterized protein n=2 Tax=Mycoplasmopsis glycophila TaxID=171285 RepID=A0A449AVZ8_9BACT|nr:Uncharacterised protein [Mycoplasmopsis glycophila]